MEEINLLIHSYFNVLRRFQKFAKYFLFAFLALNVIANFHAYNFTHFDPNAEYPRDASEMSLLDVGEAFLFGLQVPRPPEYKLPSRLVESRDFEIDGKKISTWFMCANEQKGTYIMFPGYGGSKGHLFGRAAALRRLGYSSIMVDFPGAGGSEGNETTVGYEESKIVEELAKKVREQGEENIYLFGISMGAVAILKSAAEAELPVNGLVVECPFGDLLQAVRNRFDLVNVPSWPCAELLVFWGGVQQGYWAFDHSPIQYANNITEPTMILYGAQDRRVKEFEVDRIYHNLAGEREIVKFPEAAHNNIMSSDREKWLDVVENFTRRYLRTSHSAR